MSSIIRSICKWLFPEKKIEINEKLLAKEYPDHYNKDTADYLYCENYDSFVTVDVSFRTN
jgi:hypothetical protein